jgi:hypothetical protein
MTGWVQGPDVVLTEEARPGNLDWDWGAYLLGRSHAGRTPVTQPL